MGILKKVLLKPDKVRFQHHTLFFAKWYRRLGYNNNKRKNLKQKVETKKRKQIKISKYYIIKKLFSF